MICCLGLLIGLTVGSWLGGPWIFVAPVVGFVAGLFVDNRLMKFVSAKKCGV
jgi:hypothetical protein